MFQSTSTIHSEHAKKYLVVLCRHFARKVPATWTDTEGSVEFPVGLCTMSATDSQLNIHCQANQQDKLLAQQSILDKHMDMFSRRETINLVWQQLDIHSHQTAN